MHKKRKRLSLKTAYYMAFTLFIVIPLLLVLFIALLLLNQQFKKQAIENIERAQDNIITELTSDIHVMSMRLSHLIYTNNNEIMGYAAGTDTEDTALKYEYEQKLSQAGNLALEPVKSIVSVGFYMKDGKETYIKNSISRTDEEIRNTVWYQAALDNPNSVYVGFYDTVSANDLYTGGRKDLLILVFALSPDVTIDRSQKIEMVAFYQMTGAGDTVKEYNQDYLKGENNLGIMRITDEGGNIVFSTVEQEFGGSKYTCVKTPVQVNSNTWYVESFIKTSELTEDFSRVAGLILATAVLIFAMAGFYSGYFLRNIVKPVEEISGGLRKVEEGNLDIHISPKGQFELRGMIHQFNAMVRRLRALIEEYEERVQGAARRPADYFAAMIKGEMEPLFVNTSSKEFFAEGYVLIGLAAENYPAGQSETGSAQKLIKGFERNPRFTARCIIYEESTASFLIFYRVTEEDYISRIVRMLEELQTGARKELGVSLSACIGRERFGYSEFLAGVQEIREKICLRFLYGEEAIINLKEEEDKADRILSESSQYKKLADALYVADEKNLSEEKEKLFELLERKTEEEAENSIYAAILAIAMRFETDNTSFSDVFEKKYHYPEKLGRLKDVRSRKLWLTNYFAWIMDYSAAKLNLLETDVIIRAKRFIADNYEDADLSLAKVADYVGLNEKYFTNRFSKETGETFVAYLTGIRMQKAKELLKSTTFKIYEISEMVGYHNVEHFNRMFKKLNGISPAQYRKTM